MIPNHIVNPIILSGTVVLGLCAGCYDDAGNGTSCIVPPAPRLISPHNGEKISALKPRFMWQSTLNENCPDSPQHEIQVDDSCTTPGFLSCAFPSPEISASGIAVETFTPSSDLPAGSEPPVGKRYYWRVRSCYGSSCSPWSPARYFIAGKGWAIDFNGDGFGDLAIGAASNIEASNPKKGKVYLYYGPIAGDVLEDGFSLRLENPDNLEGGYYGSSVIGGDFNGDGYTDLGVGAPGYGAGEGEAGKVYIYNGASSGISIAQFMTLTNPQNQGGSGFGSSMTSAGDLNADGFDDLVVGSPWYDADFTDEGYVAVFHGSSSGISGEPSLILFNPEKCTRGEFGRVVAAGGDVNGDGFGDILIASHCLDPFDTYYAGTGKTFIYYGSPSGIDPQNYDKLEYPETLEIYYSYKNNNSMNLSSAGDVNADGFNDIVVGFFWKDAGAIYYGSSRGVSDTSFTEIANPEDTLNDKFGFSVASAGDLNGDGFADLIIGSPKRMPSEDLDRDKMYIYHGSSTGINELPYIVSIIAYYYSDITWSIAVPGDLDGNETIDIAAGGPRTSSGDNVNGMVFLFLSNETGDFVEPRIQVFFPDYDSSISARFGCSITTGNYN